PPPHLPSFPTRRSSDLTAAAVAGLVPIQPTLPTFGVAPVDLLDRHAQRLPRSAAGESHELDEIGNHGRDMSQRRIDHFVRYGSRSEEHTSELQSRSDLV